MFVLCQRSNQRANISIAVLGSPERGAGICASFAQMTEGFSKYMNPN